MSVLVLGHNNIALALRRLSFIIDLQEKISWTTSTNNERNRLVWITDVKISTTTDNERNRSVWRIRILEKKISARTLKNNKNRCYRVYQIFRPNLGKRSEMIIFESLLSLTIQITKKLVN